MKTAEQTPKIELVYNTLSGQYYVIVKGQRKERCLFISNSGKYYYKNNGIVYLTEAQTERAESFINQ